MSDPKRLWRLMLPIALLAFVLGTMFGDVWHRHINSSPETCPICHMSHQAVEPAVADLRVSILVPTGHGIELQNYRFLSRLAIQRIPVRGPPA